MLRSMVRVFDFWFIGGTSLRPNADAVVREGRLETKLITRDIRMPDKTFEIPDIKVNDFLYL